MGLQAKKIAGCWLPLFISAISVVMATRASSLEQESDNVTESRNSRTVLLSDENIRESGVCVRFSGLQSDSPAMQINIPVRRNGRKLTSILVLIQSGPGRQVYVEFTPDLKKTTYEFYVEPGFLEQDRSDTEVTIKYKDKSQRVFYVLRAEKIIGFTLPTGQGEDRSINCSARQLSSTVRQLLPSRSK